MADKELDVMHWLGKPYGTGAGQYTCYSLIREIIAGIDGTRLPAEGARKTRTDRVQTSALRWQYTKIAKPIVGCVAVMFEKGDTTHCGIYIGNGKVVHCTEALGVTINTVEQLKVEGYYTWRK